MKDRDLKITETMHVYRNMPASTRPFSSINESYVHTDVINEVIELFLMENIEPEKDSRVSYKSLYKYFLIYWNTTIADNEELKKVTGYELDATLKRYIMNNLAWTTLHSHMWIVDRHFIPDQLLTISHRIAS